MVSESEVHELLLKAKKNIAVNFHIFLNEFATVFWNTKMPQQTFLTDIMCSWRPWWQPHRTSCTVRFVACSWRLNFLTVFPDGQTVGFIIFRGSRGPSRNAVRNSFLDGLPSEICNFPDTLFPTARSWRAPSLIHIPDGSRAIPDGSWPSGISLFGVVTTSWYGGAV